MPNFSDYKKTNNTYKFHYDPEIEIVRNSLVGQVIELKAALRAHGYAYRYWSKELSSIISKLEFDFEGISTLIQSRNELSRSSYLAPLPMELCPKISLILSNLSFRLRDFGVGVKKQ